MIEIKFLKELPVRSLNVDKCPLKINGADIYTDKDGNRFAYIEFQNKIKQPAYALYFTIKEYDSFGSFIKEIMFSLPAIYAPKGKYIIEKPVSIEQECDGIELYVSYIEFSHSTYFKEKFGKASHLGEFVPNFYEGAPKQVSKSFLAGGSVSYSSSSATNENESNSHSELKNDSLNLANESSVESASTKTAVESEIKESVSNVDSTLNEPITDTSNNGNSYKNVGFKFNWVNLALIVIAVLIVVIGVSVANSFIPTLY